MIGKVSLGSYAKGILEYCYYDKELLDDKAKQDAKVRGEIIYIQNLALNMLPNGKYDIDYLTKQFVENINRNTNLSKPIWHQSFSFKEGENISNDQIREITEAFCKDFGFENNQIITFRHDDTNHPHFHIVGNRIDSKGKNSADHFNNYKRTGLFCRKIEEELGLTIAPQMHILESDFSKRRELVSESKIADYMRERITFHIPKVSTVDELCYHLKKDGIKTRVGRGIAFTLKDKGVTFKGSQLGREFSLQNIEKQIQNFVPQITTVNSEKKFTDKEDELKEKKHEDLSENQDVSQSENIKKPTLKVITPQSGKGNLRDAEEAKDIRSLQEKKKDQERRMGRIR
jgi:Relaxase/Mobilisation nuclease domain